MDKITLDDALVVTAPRLTVAQGEDAIFTCRIATKRVGGSFGTSDVNWYTLIAYGLLADQTHLQFEKGSHISVTGTPVVRGSGSETEIVATAIGEAKA